MTARAPVPVLVLGAGVAGLTAAAQLARWGIPTRVVEAGPRIAGMADSHVDADGFTYDIGAHFITNRLAAACGIGPRCHVLQSYGEIFHLGDGRQLHYPLGLLRSPRYVGDALRQRVVDGLRQRRRFANVAERFEHDYGPSVARDVAIPVVQAWSGEPAERLAASVAEKIPGSILRTIWLRLAQRASQRAVTIGYCRDRPESAAVFHVYPRDGVAEVCRALAARLASPVQVNQPAQKIYIERGRVVGARVADTDLDVAALVSTLPVNRLHQLVDGSDACQRFTPFRFRGLVLVNLKLRGRGLLPETVLWTPVGPPFFRLTEAPMSMPWLAPEGKTVVLCELGAQPGDDTWRLDDDTVTQRCLDALEAFIPGVRQRLIGANVMRQPLGYPIYSLDYEPTRQALETSGTGVDGLVSIGRNGEFDHLLMEDIYWRTVRRIDALAHELSGHALPGAA